MESILESPPLFLAEYGIEFFITSRFESGLTAKKHMHPAVEFIYVTGGRFEIEVDGISIFADIGDMVLFRSNVIHTIKKLGDEIGSYYVLKIAPTLLFSMFQKDSISYILPFLKSGAAEFCFRAADQPKKIQKMWREMITEYEANEPSFFAMQRFLSCEFLLNCARYLEIRSDDQSYNAIGINEPNFRRISESVNYINENFASPLTAAACAAFVNLSYSHYAKLFHAVIGKSFKAYLTDLRMVRAYNMLLSSPLSVSDVAIASGYENFSYFISEFKKRYGFAPGNLRRKLQGLDIGDNIG